MLLKPWGADHADQISSVHMHNQQATAQRLTTYKTCRADVGHHYWSMSQARRERLTGVEEAQGREPVSNLANDKEESSDLKHGHQCRAQKMSCFELLLQQISRGRLMHT